MLEKRRILIGITGGIAAYKVPLLIRTFRKQGAEVKVVLTPSAGGFIGDDTIRTLSGNPVYRDGVPVYDMDHIRLAEWAELFLICPATANTIAKMAHGIADNLVTSLALSIAPRRIVVAPAMNTAMWENPVTKENVALLKNRDIRVLPVGEGELACSTSGAGRMIEIDEIAEFAAMALGNGSAGIFTGKNILISSGPTEEPIDPVRVITNRSSGKMGAALAQVALDLGATVTVVSGPSSEPIPQGAQVVRVRTAAEMRSAMAAAFDAADICIMAAAVSDFRPARISETKIRRVEGQRLILELDSNDDILAELGKRKNGRFIAGFALETDDGEASAKRKMATKGCDMMILNRADESLALPTTKMTIFHADGSVEPFESVGKADAAALILQRIAARLGLDNG
jgi:phosphopantothenoylcysteine decarboxylase / phosphopantothenate---cysteine ligase